MALRPPEKLLTNRLDVSEFVVNENFREDLLGEGFVSFKDFFTKKGIEAMREVPGRLTVSVVCADKKFFLKRHWQKGSDSKKRGPHYEAISEWESTRELQKAGIRVPEPLAFGLGRSSGYAVSFYISASVEGVQGDYYLRDKILTRTEKRLFLDRLATFAKNFHQKGYNHRDFYLCHLFIKEASEDFKVSLIDLQRVQKRKKFRRRWLIKDIGQLFYSFPDQISSTDRLRFFKKYRGVESLSVGDKKFLKDVLNRVKALEKKVGKYRV